MKKPSESRGIAVKIAAPREKSNSISSLIAALAVTVGAASAVCSALETDGIFAAICGAIAVVFEWFCAKNRTVFACANAAILAAILAISLVFHDSFAALANRAFELSEKYQMYVYTRFSAGNATETAALATIFAAVGALAGIASVRRLRSIFVAIFAIFVAFSVYFGLFSTAVPTLVFCAATLVAATTSGRESTAAILAILLTMTMGFALFPGENTNLHNFTEDIRDRFGEQLLVPDNDTNLDETLLNLSFIMVKPNDFGEISDLRAEQGENFSGSTLGAAQSQRIRMWMVLLMAALILAAVGFPIVRAYLGERRRRKAFASDDIARAVDAMFRAAVERLAAAGLQRRNAPPALYADEVAALVDEGCRAAFVEAARLRDEALYSGHPLDESHRARMREFLEITARETRDKIGFRRRMALKLGLLGGEK